MTTLQWQMFPNAVKQAVAVIVTPALGNVTLIHPVAIVPHPFQLVGVVVICVPPGGTNRAHRSVESNMFVSQTVPWAAVVKRVASPMICGRLH